MTRIARLATWVAHAYRRYHAGEITQAELQRTVLEHRGPPPAPTGNPDDSSADVIPLRPTERPQ